MAPEDPRNGAWGMPSDTAPDDARELDRDVAALHRERRAQRRRARHTALLTRRRGLSAVLVVGVLAVVSVFGTLLVVLHPSFPTRSPAAPLAAPAVPVGQVGGLLPEGPVLTPAGHTTVRSLARPGVRVLVPAPCDCDAVVASVVTQAYQVTRTVRLLSTGAQDPTGAQAAALRSGPARGLATSGVDEQGAVAAGVAAQGVTVVLVAGDGVLVDVVRDVQPTQRLGAELGRLQARR